EERIDAHAEHLRVRGVEPRERIAERAELLRAHRAERRGEKRQHDRPAALRAERHRLALVAGESEIRRFRSNVRWHRSSVPPAERAQRVKAVMERTRVADMADRLCSKLSKGYRQRVGLAQAIIHNPDVLILDEPTAGLDPKQIIETRQLIKELAGDHTIILSTHILPEVSQTCQRVVIINKGRVVAIDTPDNLTARLRGSETMYLQVDAAGADAAA